MSGPTADDQPKADVSTDRPAEASSTPPTAPPTAPPAQPDVVPSPPTNEDDRDLPHSQLPADYYTDRGVPTFDAVAERIQQRSATADGNDILDAESVRGRQEDDDYHQLKEAGKDRLAQLRKQMGYD